MFARLDHIQLLRYAGLFTWAMVGFPMLYVLVRDRDPAGPHPLFSYAVLGLICWGVFGIAFALSTRSLGRRRITLVDQGLLMLLTLSAVGVSYFNANGLGSILLMLAACVLPWLMPLWLGVVWLMVSQLIIAPVFMVGFDFPPLEAVMQALLYAGFAGFVYATSRIAQQQAQAREEQRRLNSELRATRALLAESVRVNERTRISRELHDLLGHHLTALSLNLEVANHLSEGKVQEHVSQAHTLAKLLLSDVREAVSRIRDSDDIDMAATLLPLADNVPGLHIDMRLPQPFLIDDPERAHVLLRCTQEIVTNVVRHAQASSLVLEYRWQDEGLVLEARDDGRGAESPEAGNGLRGMRERLAACGGRVEIRTRPGEGFALMLYLPVARGAERSGWGPGVGGSGQPPREAAA
jgi:glucose-6-phosphate-specific signal transduction histidine kinase